MKPFRGDIEKLTLSNKDYRRVIHTTNEQQLVLMSLEDREYIPLETHDSTSQFIRIESGKGIAYIDREKKLLRDGVAIVIPAGSKHVIYNTGKIELKLYTIYSPPEHAHDLVEKRM